jgi:hypothetical protein
VSARCAEAAAQGTSLMVAIKARALRSYSCLARSGGYVGASPCPVSIPAGLHSPLLTCDAAHKRPGHRLRPGISHVNARKRRGA